MKTRILLLSLLCWAICTPAAAVTADEPDVAALVAAAPRAGGYPRADVVTLYKNTEYKIDAEGRLNKRVHTLVRILTDWGMRQLSDTRVDWDSDRQELDITVCRTHIPGGAILDTPPNGFNEVTPDAVARSAAFLGIREMVISHVGVEAQAVLELDYTIRDLQPGILPAGSREFLQGQWPIGLCRVSVTVTEGVSLLHELLQAPASWLESARDGLSFTVTARDLPGLPNENNKNHRGDYLPCVVFGTGANDWEGLARRLQVLNEIGTKTDESMRAWLAQSEASAEIERDLTKLDTVQRIARLVGAETRTINPPTGLLCRAPRPATAVFASASATRWEKALLTMALLREAGLEPEIGFVGRFESFADDTPSVADFSDLRVVVPLIEQTSGRNWWLAPDQNEAQPGTCDLPGRTILFIENLPGGFRTYHVPPATGSSLLAVDIAPATNGGFSARIDFSASGLLRGDQTNADTDALAGSLANALLHDAEVVSTELLQISPRMLHLRIEATGASLADMPENDTADAIVFDLPAAPLTAIDLLPRSCRINAGSRCTPLFMPGELDEELRLRLTLPDHLEVDYRPADIDLAGAGGCYTCSGNIDGKILTFSRRLTLPGDQVSPTAWADLRTVLNAVTAPRAGHIVLLRN